MTDNAILRYLRAKALESDRGEPLPSPDAAPVTPEIFLKKIAETYTPEELAEVLKPSPIRVGTYKWRNKENRQRQMRELMRKRRAEGRG